MNRQRDDEYGSLRDLFGSFDEAEESPDPDLEPDDPADVDVEPDDLDGLALPPGLPPEYVEAYRRGYERARRGGEPSSGPDRAGSSYPPPAPSPATERGPAPVGHEPTRVIARPVTPPSRPAATSSSRPSSPPPGPPQTRPAPPAYDEEPSRDENGRRLPLVALALGGAALLLVVAAFGVGRMFADDGSTEESAAESAASDGEAGGEPVAYDGPVESVRIAGSSATCQSPSSVDAAGNQVTYEPAMAHDSDVSTAWRCNGAGRGQRFTVSVPEGTVVAEVGLVPGYAKTDPVSGVDRYAENNRITRVRWRFDDGSTYVQRMRGGPGDRSMRTMRVPETATSNVVIEILRSQPGPRNTVAISEIRIASPAG
jgi:hypothetical protein